MKHLIMALAIITLNAGPALAEERDVANATHEQQQEETSSYDEKAERSFFEPKTEADLNALAVLGNDLEISLRQED